MNSLYRTSMRDDAGFGALRRVLDEKHPDLRFGRVRVDGQDEVLRAEHGGMRVFWIYGGEGEVFLRSGFRTKEGDGRGLPSEYSAERAGGAFLDALTVLAGNIGDVDEASRAPVQSILARRRGGHYIGDCANELWKLEHSPKPWSRNEDVMRALAALFLLYRNQGYSVKTESSWERVLAGDQLIAAGDEALQVRGDFSCLTIEKVGRVESHIPAAMRLRYLKDSSGGCNFDFDPFRRLPLTWYWNLPGEEGDGLNFVNSHVVNIAQETSPTHFHPPVARGGGAPQNEIYLVLDPEVYGLNTYGRKAHLLTFPDLCDLRHVETHDLAPGDLVYIPAGTGHRGMDVFVNVITLPGFKPGNEFYIDREIFDAAGDTVPSNASLFHIRNYETLTSVLDGAS